MKSMDEEYCKRVFDNYLRHDTSIETSDWEDVEQKDEPPDYRLTVDGKHYAVEVTILMSNLDSEGVNQPYAAMLKSIDNLKDRIQKEAENLGLLDGAYTISINKPIPAFRERHGTIAEKALSYMQSHLGSKDAAERVIFMEGRIRASIKKTQSNRRYVAINGSTLIKWEGDAADEFLSILNCAVETKMRKMAKLKEDKILLLYDGYHLAPKAQVMKCASRINAIQAFAMIYVVNADDSGFLLYRKDKMNQGSIMELYANHPA